MLTKKISLFSLIHITSNSSYKKIMESHGMKPSIHDVSKGKLQWLGDGIYFWDVNDQYAINLGKNLVKGRSPWEKLVGIKIDLEIDKMRILNLENDEWHQQYVKFLKRTAPEHYKKILEYKQIVQEQQKANIKDLNKLGTLTGTTINLFLKFLKNTTGREFDLVLGYFYHQNNGDTKPVFAREKKEIPQYCIKNNDIVNNCIDTWKVNHNI